MSQERVAPASGQGAPFAAHSLAQDGRLVDRAARWIGNDAVAVPLSIFIGSRLAVFLMATVFGGLIPVEPGQPCGVLDAFLRWDGAWYTRIATDGYSWKGPDHQSSVAFFPLYPVLAKVFSIVLPGDVRIALVAVSNVAFGFYLFYLYRLATRDFGAAIAERSLVYVAIFSLSFYFSAGYTESLMLALTTASICYAREGNWKVAIPLGALTTLTRLAAAAILLPLAWEWYQQKGATLRALWLLGVPAGLVVFMVYLTQLTGDPLAFSTVQSAWGRSFTWPWDTIGIAWQLVTTLPRTRYVTAIAWVDFVCIATFLVLCLTMIGSMPPAYWLYAIPVYLLATSTTLTTTGLPTASIARYLMVIFPAFILMAMLGRNRHVHYIILFLSASLLGPLMIYFFAGVWVE